MCGPRAFIRGHSSTRRRNSTGATGPARTEGAEAGGAGGIGRRARGAGGGSGRRGGVRGASGGGAGAGGGQADVISSGDGGATAEQVAEALQEAFVPKEHLASVIMHPRAAAAGTGLAAREPVLWAGGQQVPPGTSASQALRDGAVVTTLEL